MQIGPRIRVGGSVGKVGQKLKIGAGKVASKAAPVVSFFNPMAGAALGVAGDALDTSDGAFDFKKAAVGALKNYAIGKAGQAVKSGVGALRSGQGVGAALKTTVGMGSGSGGAEMGLEGGNIAGAADRFRSVGGFLKDNLGTIAQVGKIGEGIYDRYQQNQDRKMAEAEYRSLAPLREQAMKGLLDTSRPDLSTVFMDPDAPSRYRPVTVGSRGRL